MKTAEKIVSKIVKEIVIGEEYGWPPSCFGVFYQPERPDAKTAADQSNENEQED